MPFALLRLARLSNAPTVASQCLAGAALGAIAQRDGALDGVALLRSVGVVLLTYAGGMILNDVLDEPVDRRERPDRPLPSGQISRATAAAAAVACLGGALGLAWGWGHETEARFATALVIAAVVYDAMHLVTSGSVVLLGICRGLVYPVAALGQHDGASSGVARDAPIAMAVFVGLYVTLFSLVARGEAEREKLVSTGVRCNRCGSREIDARPTCPSCGQAIDAASGQGVIRHRRADPWQRGPWLEWLAIVPLLGVVAAAAPRDPLGLPAALALIVVTMIAGRRARAGGAAIGPAVGLWIAAIALVDATLLFALGKVWLGLGAVACFLLARLAARRIAPS
jgi:ribosomal protein L37E